MFDEPGIGLDDLAWIQRDQFVHYVEQTRLLSNLDDWPRLRQDLLQALRAAFGLDITGTGAALAREVLDEVRARHDPAADWPGFFDALWEHRHELRGDLC